MLMVRMIHKDIILGIQKRAEHTPHLIDRHRFVDSLIERIDPLDHAVIRIDLVEQILIGFQADAQVMVQLA